jgi:hypothetical protein
MRNLAFLPASILCLSGVAYAPGELLPNSIDCSQFKKVGNEWTEVGTATFDFGPIKQVKISRQSIQRCVFLYDGVDLYDVLETKCGST